MLRLPELKNSPMGGEQEVRRNEGGVLLIMLLRLLNRFLILLIKPYRRGLRLLLNYLRMLPLILLLLSRLMIRLLYRRLLLRL